MKNIKFMYSKITLLSGLLFVVMMSCERDITDKIEFAHLAKSGEIFTDSPIGLGEDFYKPYTGSKETAWTVDESEGYESAASMRFDVPNENDPAGNYAGASFIVDGSGRDLTEFDALTFWAKASRGVAIGAMGFGQDFGLNKYEVSDTGINLGTNWQKYVIPIPDASKLFDERGMFWYSAGTQSTGGSGYTFWIDELKFEKLGTIGQPRPAIVNGEDIVQDAFVGVSIELTGLTQTFNLGNGLDKTVTVAPSYFDFTSSDPSLAFIDQFGIITVNNGSPVITASLGGVEAAGSLTINPVSGFELAPTPTRDPSDVISVFSDTYTNVNVDYYNGFWTPGSTTGSDDFVFDGDNVLNYTNFNYVGTAMSNPTLDASEMTHFHLNLYIPDAIPSDFDFLISIEDWGPNQVDNGTPNDDTRQQIFVKASQVVSDTWITVEASLELVNKNNIGLIIYENINNSSLSNFYVDNVYFYKEN